MINKAVVSSTSCSLSYIYTNYHLSTTIQSMNINHTICASLTSMYINHTVHACLSHTLHIINPSGRSSITNYHSHTIHNAHAPWESSTSIAKRNSLFFEALPLNTPPQALLYNADTNAVPNRS
eukprot:Lankesteria_metandrocarpae@DN3605_c0_g1_i1.p1